eukprot:4915755-Ditylum_brightwellii.AAC.1
MKQFPEDVQNALKLLSCLGTDCEEYILSLITTGGVIDEFGCTDMMSSFEFSIEEGLLDYSGSSYKFVHDQIQNAAYSLIPETDKGKLHLWIGNQVWANYSALPENAVFVAAGQLNKGKMFITEAHQITELIRLNLQAGGKSMSLGAFTPALFYLKEGLSLLGSNSWEEQYDLHLRLCESYAEAKYCAGQNTGEH